MMQNAKQAVINAPQPKAPDKVDWIDLQKHFKNKTIVPPTQDTQPTASKPDTKFLSTENRLAQEQTMAKNNPEPQPLTSPTPTQDQPRQTEDIKKLSPGSLYLSDAQLSEILDDAPPPIVIEMDAFGVDAQVKEGAKTMLSTQAFTYTSFFQRMKQSIRPFWKPNAADVNQPRASQRWTSKVLVVLGEQGDILQSSVIEGSGNSRLDALALEALGKGGPFYNPPQALFGKQKELRLTWHFIFDYTVR